MNEELEIEIVIESGIQGRQAVILEDHLRVVQEKDQIIETLQEKSKQDEKSIIDLKNKIAVLNTQIEDTYTLTYSQLINGQIVDKTVSGITKDTYEKMYSMYGSDWLGHSIKKDDVNSKDKIISNLKSRISELEEEVSKLKVS